MLENKIKKIESFLEDYNTEIVLGESVNLLGRTFFKLSFVVVDEIDLESLLKLAKEKTLDIVIRNKRDILTVSLNEISKMCVFLKIS